MIYLFGGLLVAWLALNVLRGRMRRDPAELARMVRGGGGWALVVLALLVLLRGRPEFALGFGGLGIWLLATLGRAGRREARSRTASRSSRVRTAMIEMELTPRGAMRGMILAGSREGASLDSLTEAECLAVLATCRQLDPDGARLLETYLDRRFAGWRAAGEGEADPGRAGRHEGVRSGGAMTQDEAYEVLGLQKSASREDVVRAHRTLIKKLHPDQGGSTHLAARVNAAKEVLMRRGEGREA